jgi:hypothetical protein
MAQQTQDRVKETTTTTGTGALTLAGAMTGYRAFSSVCSVGDTCYYALQAVDSAGNPTGVWEVGVGTYSAANTLTRTTILASSTGSVVSLAAGTTQVWLDMPAAILAPLVGIAAGPTGNRNGFVDGAFDSWQAGTSFAVPAGTTVYAADVWQCNVGTGGAATISRQAYALGQNLANSPIAPKFFMRYALTTASSVGGTIGQRLEGIRSYAGQSVTVSFNLKAAAALTLTQIAIVQFPGSGGSPTAAIINNKTIAWVLGTTEARYSVRLDIPAISPAITMGTNGDDVLVIRFVLPTGITFALDIGQAQIEPCRSDASSDITGSGGSPTSFEHRGYPLELSRVHRFVFKLIDTTITATGAISVGQVVTTGAGAVLLHFVSLPTNMRVLPTLNFVVGAATNLFFGAPVSAAVATLTVAAAVANNMLALSGTVSTTATAVGLCCQLRANTTATLLLADARF